jgi:membrane-bound serine protease (ClpP class)
MAAGALLVWLVATAATQDAAPHVVVAEYEGIIHPIAVEFVGDLVRRAQASRAQAALIVLRTPGGLLDSTRAIIERILGSSVPVVVFVAPPGARAASAGFLITIAADVAAMAPGTHIGAAHPVTAGGQGGENEGSDVMAQKATADAAAYARTLASTRGRNSELAGRAVTESAAFTEREALDADPPLVDLVARDVDDLLRRLDGRQVRRADGRMVTLHTAGARVERLEPTWRQRVLGAIAHPQVAYLLLMLGMLGLVVELWNPGATLPGVAGGVCLLLAFFAFQVLPISLSGLLLVVLGVSLLVAELMVPSFGVLGIGGVVALLAGSLMLTREVPGVRVSYGAIVPVVTALAVIVLFLGSLALRAHRLRPSTGLEGLIGERGEVLTSIEPDRVGQVRVHGEIWRAVSDAALPAGRTVQVTGFDGLTLRIEASDTAPGGGTS